MERRRLKRTGKADKMISMQKNVSRLIAIGVESIGTDSRRLKHRVGYVGQESCWWSHHTIEEIYLGMLKHYSAW